jgi:hypothetical protein
VLTPEMGHVVPRIMTAARIRAEVAGAAKPINLLHCQTNQPLWDSLTWTPKGGAQPSSEQDDDQEGGSEIETAILPPFTLYSSPLTSPAGSESPRARREDAGTPPLTKPELMLWWEGTKHAKRHTNPTWKVSEAAPRAGQEGAALSMRRSFIDKLSAAAPVSTDSLTGKLQAAAAAAAADAADAADADTAAAMIISPYGSNTDGIDAARGPRVGQAYPLHEAANPTSVSAHGSVADYSVADSTRAKTHPTYPIAPCPPPKFSPKSKNDMLLRGYDTRSLEAQLEAALALASAQVAVLNTQAQQAELHAVRSAASARAAAAYAKAQMERERNFLRREQPPPERQRQHMSRARSIRGSVRGMI